MLILSVDTSAKTMSVALTDDSKLLALTIVNSPNTHSKTLLPAIKNLLDSCGVAVSEVGLFACSHPGSFTGVRIGVSTIKGLAYPTGTPCIGVSALASLATNVRATAGIICPVMDARRNQVYNAIFRSDGEKLQRLTDDRAISVDELLLELSDLGECVTLVGDGCYLFEKSLQEHGYLRLSTELERYQNAYSVALVALQEFDPSRVENYSPSALQPFYLRQSSAQKMRNSENN